MSIDIEKLLTQEEHHAVDLCAQLAQSFIKILGNNQDSDDYKEAEFSIHALQNMVLSQAAARAYPDLYRQLGKGFDKEA
jgi:hypothetical protein